MKYQEFQPAYRLRPYVKCFYYFEATDAAPMSDVVFPGGSMELIFNIGNGLWKVAPRNKFQTTPKIELWGQLTRPLPVRSEGKNRMLGVRLSGRGAAAILCCDLSEFNDHVTDACDVLGNEIYHLRELLLEEGDLRRQLSALEIFLAKRFLNASVGQSKIEIIDEVSKQLQSNSLAMNIKTIAERYDITPRYLQQLFLKYTGVTPKLFHKIHRFQNSLKLVATGTSPLTNIAYDCGYADQSHFIREFKTFTGITPSNYTAELFPVSLAITS